MPTDTIELSADRREILGKRVRFLRRQGLIPANVYGRARESVPLQIQAKDLQRALAKGGRTTVIGVSINGEKSLRTAVIRGLQRDPRTDELLHVDFLEVDVTQSITADIPIVLVGESPVSKSQSAMISQSLVSLQIEGLPTDLPRSIDVDISGLVEIDQEVRVRDLSVPTSISVLADPDQLVVKVARGRIVVEEEVAAEAEEEEAEVEGVEGEAPEAEAPETEGAEPEAEQAKAKGE
ncbi:MAG: 50S ribosomal protein L25 [Dehalococcoidia bacterium]